MKIEHSGVITLYDLMAERKPAVFMFQGWPFATVQQALSSDRSALITCFNLQEQRCLGIGGDNPVHRLEAKLVITKGG